jgi:hypothetical protein
MANPESLWGCVPRFAVEHRWFWGMLRIWPRWCHEECPDSPLAPLPSRELRRSELDYMSHRHLSTLRSSLVLGFNHRLVGADDDTDVQGVS